MEKNCSQLSIIWFERYVACALSTEQLWHKCFIGFPPLRSRFILSLLPPNGCSNEINYPRPENADVLLCMLLTPNAASTENEARNVHHTQAISEELDNGALPPPDKACKNYRFYSLLSLFSSFFPISLFT